MKTSKILSLTCALSLALMFSAPALLFPQTVTPKGYWRFENPNPLDNTANPSFPVTLGTTLVVVQNTNPILGQYYESRSASGLVPGIALNFDDQFRQQQLSFEFWIRFAPAHRRGSIIWPGKAEVTFADNAIVWETFTNNGNYYGLHPIYLSGTGASDPQSIYDGKWHHFAFTFDLCNQQQKVFLDGICPPGWTRTLAPAGGSINDGGNLLFGTSAPADRLMADLDEFAVYDTVLTPDMVYQHYLDVVNGSPYTNTPSFTGPIPMPSNTSPYGYDPMEFAEGYPNIPERPLQLFNKYPLPRYPVNDSMHRNLPWVAEPSPFAILNQDSLSNVESRRMMEQLALDWNFMLYAGYSNDILKDFILGQNNNPGSYLFNIIESLSDGSLSGLPRFMYSSWGHSTPRLIDSTYSQASYVMAQNVPIDSFYIRDAGGIPNNLVYWYGRKVPNPAMANPSYSNDIRMELLQRDGRTVFHAVDTLMKSLSGPPSLKFLNMLGENDEIYEIVPPNTLAADQEINSDFLSHSFSNWIHYQGVRLDSMRDHYREPVISYLDSINGLAGKLPVQDIWYQASGRDDRYPWVRDILRFNDGRIRPTEDFYPLEPARWRHGVADLSGMDNLVLALGNQLALGDKLFIPAVAAGIHAGNAQSNFVTTDIAMLRPGQYLGLLKAMGGLGAEAYNSFTHWVPFPSSPSNWRPWGMPMAGYAQAAMTRAKPFLYNGKVLEGDIAHITSLSVSGTATTYYTFSTGNVNDLVVGRQLSGQNQFLITASAQRLCNAPGVTPKIKDIAFTLKDTANTVIFSPLQIEERLQGSTYILDLGNPSSPIMTQLDRWHEWKEPSRWCRDFDFEAEVWDSVTASPVTATERPAGFAAGDFREFTTFVSMPSPSDILGYRFRPRGADQDTLYFHARVRNRAVDSLSLTASVDGIAVPVIRVPPGSGWQWVSSPPPFTAIDSTTWHWLFVMPGSDSLDLDLVTLKRSGATFSTQPFSASIAANTVCLGATTQFTANLSLPAGCIDFHWDFGDGRSSYEMNPVYVYPYPGTYEVVFTAWHACLDSTVTDTIQVLVVAPMVDAGPPGMHCLGMQDTLQGFVNQGTTFSWLPDSALSSTTVLDPVVQAVGSQYFYLQGDSANCSMTDSVWVAVTPALTPLPMPDDTVCQGTMVPLWVDSVHTVWWDSVPGILYGPGCNPCFLANATQVLTWHATDACECGTVSGQVTVTVDTMLAYFDLLTVTDTLCLGDSLQLLATGGLTYGWSGGLDSVANPWAYPASTTTYSVTISGLACVVTDSVEIVVDTSLLYMSILTPPDTLCLGDSLQLLATGGLTYAWSGGLDSVANPWAYPTSTTTYIVTVSGLACVMTDSVTITVDTSYQALLTPPDTICLGDSLQLLATGGLTYAWSGGLDSLANPWTYPTSTTTYSVTISGMACVVTDSVEVVVDSSLLYMSILTPPDTLCLGDSLQLLANGGLTYGWSGGLDSVANPWAYPTGTTTYSVTISGMACVLTDSVEVMVDSSILYMSILTPPDTLCLGDSLQLLATGGLTYAWSGGLNSVANPWTYPTSTTTYSVTVSGMACVVTDSVEIVVDSSLLYMSILIPPDTLCLGDSLQLLATGGLTYTWSGGLDSLPNPWAHPAATTTYSVSISGLACVVTDSVEIVVDTIPAGMLTVDTNRVCRGDTVFLTAAGGTSYLWNDGSTLPVRAEIPQSTGWWAVTVSDGGYCSWADSVLVTVDTNCCFIPGAVVLQDTVYASAAGLANLTGGDYHVMDMLVVDVAANFSGVTFHIAPGAVIDVLPGVTVNSVGCTYTAACGDSLWGRVRLAGAGTQWRSTGDIFEHAFEALVVEAGAFASVTTSDIIACERGIRVKPVTNTNSPIDLKTNRFLGGPMLPPLQTATLGVAGVQADGVAVLDILGNNFFSGWQSGALVSASGQAFISSNTFSNCRAGINVQNTTRMGVGSPGAGRSNTFTSCVDGVVTKGSATWVVDNRFDRCTVGFRGLGPGANAATTVSGSLHALGTALADSGNIYLDCWRGISTDGKQRVVVRGDSILRSENAGVFTRFNDGGSMTVERNVLVDNTVGVFAGTSSGMAGMVKWNTIRGGNQANRTGIQCGVLTNPALGNPPGIFDLRIHENDIRLQGNGVWVESSERVDVWNNFVVVRPNTAQQVGSLHAGINVLSSNDIRVAQNTVSSDIDGAKNLGTRGIYVFSSPMTNARCNQVRSTGRCFVWEGISQPSDFLGNTMQQGKEGVVFMNDGFIGQQGLEINTLGDTSNYASDNKWMGGSWSWHTNSIATNSTGNNWFVTRPQGLFSPTLNTASGQSGTMISIANVPTNTPTQIDCQSFILQTDKGTGIKEAATAQRLQGSDFEEATQWRRDVWVHKELLKDPIMLAGDSTLQSWFGQMQGTDVEKASRAEFAMEMRDSLGAYVNASAITGNILPPTLEKSIQEARLRGVPLDSTAIGQLRILASICMDEGGPAVNRARAVLASEGEYLYENPPCASNAKASQLPEDIGIANGISVPKCWPNPTNGCLQFEFGQDDRQFATVVVHDAMARLIWKGQVQNREQVCLPIVSSGLYSVRLQLFDGSVHSWKVEVLR